MSKTMKPAGNCRLVVTVPPRPELLPVLTDLLARLYLLEGVEVSVEYAEPG